jgi:hypothetical protein
VFDNPGMAVEERKRQKQRMAAINAILQLREKSNEHPKPDHSRR